jgi:hypothetical protein
VPRLLAVTRDGRKAVLHTFSMGDESFALARVVAEWLGGATRKPFKADEG